MNKKFLILILIISVIASGLSLAPVFAKNTNDSGDELLPEQEGTYDVAGHPDLKLKVFVHHEKQNSRPSQSGSTVCNLQDPDSLALVGSAGWKLPGTWTYILNLNSVPFTVGSANLATMAADAFSRWSNATNKKVIFNKNLSNTNTAKVSFDGKNIIAWGNAPNGALAVTYTWYNKNTGLVSEVDTIMNNKFTWSWAIPTATCVNANSYDAQDILTHELGHWLGLNDFYDAVNYQNATMYGYGSKAEIKKDTLSTGDINGISAIYH